MKKERYKILIYTQDKKLSQLVAEQLHAVSNSISHCEELDAVLGIVKEKSIDMIISNIALPNGEEGMKLLEKINSMGQARPDLILISGLSELTNKRLIKIGADKLIVEPVDFVELIENINMFKSIRMKNRAA
jgi:DNA-binding response OmpR family regulator